MYIRKLASYVFVMSLCAGCDYISDVASGGGQEGVDTAKEDNAISLADIKEVLEATKTPDDPDEITNLETAGTLQGSAHSAAVSNITALVNARPKILNIVDDWGNTCAMQNSEFCGGYGVALVPAHDENITGLACGPGTAVNQMVVNYEWVPC
jgi:hypothetical protein